MTFQKLKNYGLTNSNMLVPKMLLNLGLDNLLGLFLKFENVKNWYCVNISTNNGTIGNVKMGVSDPYNAS